MKRYKMCMDCSGLIDLPILKERKDGLLVKYKDIKELEKENKQLKDRIKIIIHIMQTMIDSARNNLME